MTEPETFTCSECGVTLPLSDLPHTIHDCAAYLKRRVIQLENQLAIARSNVPHPYNSHIVIERVPDNSRLVIEQIPQLLETPPTPSLGEKK